MKVYRDAERPADPRALLTDMAARLARPAGLRREASGLLADFGEIETALTDMYFPQCDGLDGRVTQLRMASLSLARLLRLARQDAAGRDVAGAAQAAAARLHALAARPLPRSIGLRVSEGFAFYAVFPETYLVAAERFAAAVRPGRVVCIGIRSIGSSLSAAVAAGLEAAGVTVEPVTLRPRGHPFDRRPVLTGELEAWLRARVDRHFLVVDEGPGLSGSSFCGTAARLAELGVPDERIVLFPSWQPDPSAFVNAGARERWGRHAKVTAGFEDVWLRHSPLADARDLSGGGWRDLLQVRAPAHPQHERRKYLLDATVHRFAGLGRYGRIRLARAERLAQAGLGARPGGLADGFLALEWLPGRPLHRRDAGPEVIAAAAHHIGHLARHHRTGSPVRAEELFHMVETNVAEGLGRDWLDRLRGMAPALRTLAQRPAVAVDGRMLPHEWIRLPDGRPVKTDALDHHDDHFFPGPQDAAWDVAGFAVEFGLTPRARAEFAAMVGDAAGDPGLPVRLPFQTTAYLACRLGYCAMAADVLDGTRDGRFMRRLHDAYAHGLRRSLLAFPA